ncbi:MAG: tetratricopeptide repeat protein, partial [Deltaproteobacteria bacterium]|nr:tetratricopeptide repeat protein [Deltaproteobacteria bacterium]
LAEFGSVVDAVQCGVAVQNELQARNAELPENRRMQFRIGINLGDVIEEGDRIYGDGVNIAARLEALAEPGGICISKTAFDHIETKLPLGYEYLGDQTVKNIAKPVGAYRVLMEPRVTVARKPEKEQPSPVRRRAILVGAIAVLVLAVTVGIWYFYMRPAHPPVEVASVEKMAYPLPDKPSIAVLPFVNLSGDPEQEYIADGITENIITALSNSSVIFVIARNSTFTYKGKAVKVQQVSEDLGVRYVMEGSVQKSGERIRVTAQLVDATTGHHLWAKRFDREMKDLFAIQDEITKDIAVAFQVELTSGEQARIWYRGTKNLEAWGFIAKGHVFFGRFTKGDNARARELFEQAVKIDPEYAFAWTMLAWTHWVDAFFGYSESRTKSFKRTVELAKNALALDDTISDVYALLGGISLFQRQYDKAIAAGQKSIALGPNSATSHVLFGWTMTCAGRFEEAIALIKKGMRLTPHYSAYYLNHLGRPYFQTGRYEEALATYKQLLERSLKGECDPLVAHLNMAATYIMLGREEEARAHAAEVFKINPNFSLEWIRKVSLYKDPAHLERSLDALRKAGIPEKPPLPLPDKPSIAVLPFVNMSGDPEQEYFSDGITEEIITALSKTPKMFVIARNSTFTYKGKPVKVQQVSRELGVRYVLEGSVRKAGNKVRITAQLVDAMTGHHLWAERYDRDLKDIFALQDEITLKVITALRVKLTEGEQARLIGKGTKNLEAYVKTLQARKQFYRMNKQGSMESRRLAKESIALDPEYAPPYTILALTHMMDLWFKFSKSPKESMGLAVEAAQKALALDDSNPATHFGLCMLYIMQKKHDKAIAAAKRAVELSPSGANAYSAMGTALRYAGRPEEAIPLFKKAISLNPISSSLLLRNLGGAYLLAGRHEEAIVVFKRSLQERPNDLFTHLGLAVCFISLGREEEARAEAKEVLRIHPKFSLEHFAKTLPYKDQSVVDNTIACLRKAGLK